MEIFYTLTQNLAILSAAAKIECKMPIKIIYIYFLFLILSIKVQESH